MKQTTYFKNPGPSALEDRRSTQSGRAVAPSGPSTPSMDAGKKISSLAQTGGAVIGGQVAATVLTNLGLDMLGATAAPGSLQRKAGVVLGPIAMGAVLMGLSKSERVQEAAIGCVSAGVAAGVNMLMPSAKFYPVADAYSDSYVADNGMYLDAQQEMAQLYAGNDYEDASVELVTIDQLN